MLETILEPGAEFDAEDSVNSPYVYDGSQFWTKNSRGDWVSLNQSQFETFLRSKGIRKFSEGEGLSPLDIEVQRVLIEERVDFVGPLAGYRKGLQDFQGSRLLITRELPLIEPRKGEFPVFAAFLEGLLVQRNEDNNEVLLDQRPYFNGWLQHSLKALYNGQISNGVCMVLAGEAGCGKTLLKEFTRLMMGGKEAYPYGWMTNRDNFNKSLTEAALWVVDDERSNTHTLERLKFGDEIKKLVANAAMNVRGMHKESLTLAPLRRLVICVNNEPEKLMILPPLDDDIHDKITVLRCSSFDFPMPTRTESEKRHFWESIAAELPAYIHYLIHEWELPEDMYGRFGCVHFQHPDISNELMDVGPEGELLALIDRNFFTEDFHAESWEGSASDMYRALTDEDNNLTRSERGRVPVASWIGKRLSKLQKRYPNRITHLSRTSAGGRWKIQQPGDD